MTSLAIEAEQPAEEEAEKPRRGRRRGSRKTEIAADAEMEPESAEMVYWAAVTLAGVGQVDEALPRFQTAFAADPRWAVLTPRRPAAGLLPNQPALRARTLAVPGGEPALEEWRRLASEGKVGGPVP